MESKTAFIDALLVAQQLKGDASVLLVSYNIPKTKDKKLSNRTSEEAKRYRICKGFNWCTLTAGSKRFVG